MRVLLTASDSDLADLIDFALRRTGLDVITKREPSTSIEAWSEKPFDLVILAEREPEPLLRFITRLRNHSSVPILALTESEREQTTLQLLRSGADLVLHLPVSPQILAEYAHILLRRSQGMPTSALALDLGDIALDPATRQVRVVGQAPQGLTQLEFRLLYVLLTHRGQVIPSEMIVERVWGYGETGGKELVRGLVSRVRAKVEREPSHPRFIHTVPCVGYLFDLDRP